MEGILVIVYVVCLVKLIMAIKDSQRRLLSLGYAALGFLLVCISGVGALFVFVPSGGSVIDINEALNKVGTAISIAAPIAAVWGANVPPRREAIVPDGETKTGVMRDVEVPADVRVPSESASRFAAARAALSRHDGHEAGRLVAEELVSPHAGIAWAYRSLSERMNASFDAALNSALEAVKLDGQSLECCFALSVAYLSNREIENAILTHSRLKKAIVRDPGGHFFKALAFVLYAECIANMHEGPEGMHVDFRLTPCARAASRILDGYPNLAHGELSDSKYDVLFQLASGLAYFSTEDWSNAESSLTQALNGFAASDPFIISPSLRSLIATCRSAAKPKVRKVLVNEAHPVIESAGGKTTFRCLDTQGRFAVPSGKTLNIRCPFCNAKFVADS